MKLSFITLDVFTTTRYAGNALAVVLIPEGTAITDVQKLQIAREFNLSETVFLYEASGESDVFRLSIWITTQELVRLAPVPYVRPWHDNWKPFAGHPTVGAAVYLLQKRRRVTLNIPAGQINAELVDGKATLSCPFDIKSHKFQIALSDLQRVCSSVTNLDETNVFSIVKGMTFALTRLPDLDALSTVQIPGKVIRIELSSLADDERPYCQNELFFYCFVVLQETSESIQLRTRMVCGNLEDPATGSAACGLSSFLTLKDERPDVTLSYHIVQGVEMGRRSDIHVRVVKEKGKVVDVQLAGEAVQVMEGQLEV
jgi:PhzF family phenazine biosynthesis protein